MTTLKRFQQIASRTSSHLALVAVSCLAAGTAQAMQPLITDDTGTQGSGGQQIELSYTHDRTGSEGETSQTHGATASYTYGLVDSLDVFVQPGYAHEEGGAHGWGNTVTGAKWRFYGDADSGTSLALKGELALPVSKRRENEGLGTGRTSGAATLILSQQVPFGFIHFNAAVERDRYRSALDQAGETHWRLSAAPVWDVAEHWQLALDVGYESIHAGGDSGHSRFAEIGVVYSPIESLSLALGVIRQNGRAPGADSNAHTTSATAGATWHF